MITPFYKEGRYKAEVVEQALGKNQKGTPQFVLKCRIICELVEGREESVRREYERYVYMYLSDKAAPYTIEKLQGIGFDGNSIRQLDPSHPDACRFVERLVELDCKHEDDQDGNPREKWDLAYAGSGAIDLAPLEPSEARKLDALFGKSLGATAKTQPKTKAAASRSTTAVSEADPINDDDVPF